MGFLEFPLDKQCEPIYSRFCYIDARAAKMNEVSFSREEFSSYILVAGGRLSVRLLHSSPLFHTKDIYTGDSAKSSPRWAEREDS